MIQLIKKGAKLSEENRPLLWSELMLFSVMSGLVCHSWIVLVIVASGLVWLITRPNGMFYMIFAISTIWAFMPFCWGFTGGGWLWAFMLGGIVFWMGIKVHVNGLKWQWDEIVYKSDDTIQWKQMFWSGPNSSRSIFEDLK